MSLTRLASFFRDNLPVVAMCLMVLLPKQNAQGENLTIQQRLACDLYAANIEQSIRDNWHPPRTGRVAKATVAFSIARTGQLSNLRITHSSGSTQVDKSVLAAVTRSVPFSPFPPKCIVNRANIQFDFDYRVFKK